MSKENQRTRNFELHKRLTYIIIMLTVITFTVAILITIVFITLKIERSKKAHLPVSGTLDKSTQTDNLPIPTDPLFNDTNILDDYIVEYNKKNVRYTELISFLEANEEQRIVTDALYNFYKDTLLTFKLYEGTDDSLYIYEDYSYRKRKCGDLETAIGYIVKNYSSSRDFTLFGKLKDNTKNESRLFILKEDSFHWLGELDEFYWVLTKSIQNNWKNIKQKIMLNILVFFFDFFLQQISNTSRLEGKMGTENFITLISKTYIQQKLNWIRKYRNFVIGIPLFIIYQCINGEELKMKYHKFENVKERFKKEKLIIALMYQVTTLKTCEFENDQERIKQYGIHFERIDEEMENFIAVYNNE